jgi:hypothetical protein
VPHPWRGLIAQRVGKKKLRSRIIMPCLSQQTLRRLLALATLTLLSATLALAQDQPSPTDPAPDAQPFTAAWNVPEYRDWSRLYQLHLGGRLFVLTTARPKVRHRCRVQSFAADKLVCKDPLGVTHTYKSQDIAALIIPGEYDFKVRFLLGSNAALGAAIWGTIVLAPVGIPCAAATALGAFFAFSASGAILVGDDLPDRPLYLAPSQTLKVELRY